MTRLEKAEKIANIFSAGVLAVIVAAFSLGLGLRQDHRDEDSFCVGFLEHYENALARSSERGSDAIIQRYSSRCNVAPMIATQRVKEFQALAELNAEEPRQTAADTSTGDGHVAIGRLEPRKFSDLNFDLAAPAGEISRPGDLPAGTVLKARWSVNLRENTKLTTSGENPIVGLVQQGACVQLAAAPVAARGQAWSTVNLVNCPE